MERRGLSLKGVFPPIPTPFDAQGDVAYEALTENLERWNRYEISGYVVLGSNGEAVYLTDEEKTRVWETARQAIGSDRLMVAGTGCESTRQTIALSRRAADAGADAVLIVTPHYYGGQMTPDALVHHFHAVAEDSPVPTLIYNMPRFTHIDLDAVTVSRIAYHPNIAGIKDSGGNIGKLAQIVDSTEDGFHVLAGSASFFLPALVVGAVAGVMALANIAPQALIDLHRLFQRGEWDKAAALQRGLVASNSAVTSQFGIPGLKAALDMMGYYGGPVRSPLRPLTGAQVESLKQVLVRDGVLPLSASTDPRADGPRWGGR
ncbi:MAG: dihydrodipicolinate synthase family protein [Anaerolineae bacterium]|jgi:4-hydroxy-2-oxoglutarate aldolase